MEILTKKYNLLVVDALSEKYGLSKYYIKQSISGNRKGKTPETLKAEYLELVKKINEILTINKEK